MSSSNDQFKSKGAAEEAVHAKQKARRFRPYTQSKRKLFTRAQEREQLAAIAAELQARKDATASVTKPAAQKRDDIEGGHGGQEDLEDRYATTYGEH